MSDQSRDRVPYSYDDIFPERFLHAPDLDGRTVTLRIRDAWGEYIQNPKQKRKKERGDLCGVLAFHGTKREYAMSKQNAWILKALWGKDPAAYVGKRITMSPVPDTSGFTEHNTRILFTGSPDIEHDLSLTLPGGQQIAFHKTAAKSDTIVEAQSVDPVTGEVIDDDASAAQEPESRAPDPSGDTEPPGMDYDDYVASHAPDDGDSNVLPLHDAAGPATAAQLAEVKRLRRDKKLNAAQFATACDTVGGESTADDYGLTFETAGLLIETLGGWEES